MNAPRAPHNQRRHHRGAVREERERRLVEPRVGLVENQSPSGGVAQHLVGMFTKVGTVEGWRASGTVIAGQQKRETQACKLRIG